jgi:photosystem II stability/assembly factor-like uncharacterized protein
LVIVTLVRPFLALCALASFAPPSAAQHWRMQYLYDEAKSDLAIRDLQFPSASRGVAAGFITERKTTRPVAVVTSDGGAHWQIVPLKEYPLSVFFLDDSVGWMVTDKGLWRTEESGKSWTKLPRIAAPILRVWFTDAKNGWAVGAEGAAWETHDGAQSWKPLPGTQPPGKGRSGAMGNPGVTTYRWIVFATPQAGLIMGSNDPPQYSRLPGWLAPDDVLQRRETPHLSLTLETHDGGRTWDSSSASTFGKITRARFASPGRGIGLVEHAESFQYPSEVFSLAWPSGKNEVVFRDKEFFVSDAWVTPGGVYYLAGIAIASRLRDIVPQKVKVLTSRDLKEWKALDVDYRAVANRVTLAGSGDDLWMATNNGMILKLAP